MELNLYHDLERRRTFVAIQVNGSIVLFDKVSDVWTREADPKIVSKVVKRLETLDRIEPRRTLTHSDVVHAEVMAVFLA